MRCSHEISGLLPDPRDGVSLRDDSARVSGVQDNHEGLAWRRRKRCQAQASRPVVVLVGVLTALGSGCYDSDPRSPYVPLPDIGVVLPDASVSADSSLDSSAAHLSVGTDGFLSPQAAVLPTGIALNTGATWVGRNLIGSFDEDDALFRLRQGSASVEFVFDSDIGALYLSLVPADRDFLAPGPYPFATRLPFNSGLAAGFSFWGRGAGCNESDSSFYIRELELNRVGIVQRLRVDFRHHCSYETAWDVGVITWNARGVDDPVPDRPWDCAVAEPMGFCVASPAGDTVGQGAMIRPDERDGAFSWAGDATSVVIAFRGEIEWGFRLSAPTGQSLAPGEYVAGNVSTPSLPSMSVGPGVDSVSSNSCVGLGALEGRFEIFEIEWDGDVLTRLSADVEQACRGMPALYGKIRFGASFEP